jgi:flagellar biosynthesis/type III secretory pathway protein FliH
MNLLKLGNTTSYTTREIKYFLSFIREIEAEKFVAELCQAAYEIGYEDGYEDGENKGELDSAPKEVAP